MSKCIITKGTHWPLTSYILQNKIPYIKNNYCLHSMNLRNEKKTNVQHNWPSFEARCRFFHSRRSSLQPEIETLQRIRTHRKRVFLQHSAKRQLDCTLRRWCHSNQSSTEVETMHRTWDWNRSLNKWHASWSWPTKNAICLRTVYGIIVLQENIYSHTHRLEWF